MPGYAYGGSAIVEPEGFELESAIWREPWTKCHAQALAWRFEVAEGSLNIYRGLRPLRHARVSGAGPLARRASGPARSSRRGELLPRASHGTVRAGHAYGSLDQSIRTPAPAGLIPAACEDLATGLLATSSVR
jgi:hypothetical protein